ncbi:MAG: hypothetical protein Ct9H300mP8_03040 [Gammaproteobacteria bacterium]|nr:MAG: hypothetical protein Ct9H300mP8_03040 [Gammaproteobacteria bacterium]
MFAKISVRENSDGLLAVAPVRVATERYAGAAERLIFNQHGHGKTGEPGDYIETRRAGCRRRCRLWLGHGLLNPNVVRAVWEQFFRASWRAEPESVGLGSNATIFGSSPTPDADRLYTEADMVRPCAILMGVNMPV